MAPRPLARGAACRRRPLARARRGGRLRAALNSRGSRPASDGRAPGQWAPRSPGGVVPGGRRGARGGSRGSPRKPESGPDDTDSARGTGRRGPRGAAWAPPVGGTPRGRACSPSSGAGRAAPCGLRGAQVKPRVWEEEAASSRLRRALRRGRGPGKPVPPVLPPVCSAAGLGRPRQPPPRRSARRPLAGGPAGRPQTRRRRGARGRA